MVMRLGELVEAVGTGGIDLDVLAGALMEATAKRDAETIARWPSRGASYFALRCEPRPRNA